MNAKAEHHIQNAVEMTAKISSYVKIYAADAGRAVYMAAARALLDCQMPRLLLLPGVGFVLQIRNGWQTLNIANLKYLLHLTKCPHNHDSMIAAMHELAASDTKLKKFSNTRAAATWRNAIENKNFGLVEWPLHSEKIAGREEIEDFLAVADLQYDNITEAELAAEGALLGMRLVVLNGVVHWWLPSLYAAKRRMSGDPR